MIKETKDLTDFLRKLQALEAKLWGVTINDIATSEEKVLEDTNHLIYLLTREKNHELLDLLSEKEVKDFLLDIKNLKDDFLILKKQVMKQNKLRNFIASLSIKIVNRNNYMALENIFVLESQLYTVLDSQETSLKKIIKEISNIKAEEKTEKVKIFIDYLVQIREILGGHLDHHNLWEEERMGYSNVSNIISALIRELNRL